MPGRNDHSGMPARNAPAQHRARPDGPVPGDALPEDPRRHLFQAGAHRHALCRLAGIGRQRMDAQSHVLSGRRGLRAGASRLIAVIQRSNANARKQTSFGRGGRTKRVPNKAPARFSALSGEGWKSSRSAPVRTIATLWHSRLASEPVFVPAPPIGGFATVVRMALRSAVKEKPSRADFRLTGDPSGERCSARPSRRAKLA